MFLDCAKACVADTMCLAWRFISLKNATNYTEITSSGKGCRLIYRRTIVTGIDSTGRRLRGALATDDEEPVAGSDSGAMEAGELAAEGSSRGRRGMLAFVGPAYVCTSDNSATSGEVRRALCIMNCVVRVSYVRVTHVHSLMLQARAWAPRIR